MSPETRQRIGAPRYSPRTREVRYLPQELFVANTDKAWFDFLSERAVDGVVDEVNFWLPKATRPMRGHDVGEPILFRLKKPVYAIAGFGFFAHFAVVDLDTAWSTFGWKNGDPDKLRFLRRIGGYRGLDLTDPRSLRAPIGCTVLRDAHFWPRERWLPWREAQGWKPQIVQGKAARGADARALVHLLYDDLTRLPGELTDGFTLVDMDQRELRLREVATREGQGAFRLRLLQAYEGQCAITGEHTTPVLDAAHIQPYLGPPSNHVRNGLVLTKEFHALFDRGYVAVTPDYEVRVSGQLREEFKNGHRYYPFDGKRLVQLPRVREQQPSRDALAWHYENVFLRDAG